MGVFGDVANFLGGGNNTQGQMADTTDADYNTNLYNILGQQLGSNVNNQQSALSNMLMQQSQGQGPNPALAQEQQTTQQNIAEGNSQIASQKGINPGLANKQILENTAAQNQTAAGQGAVLEAQQQLAAESALGSNLSNQGSLQNQSLATLGGLQNNQNSNTINNSLGAQGLTATAAGQNAGFGQQLTGGLIGGLSGGLVKMYEGGQIDSGHVPGLHQIPVTEWLNALHDTGITHPDQIRMFAYGGMAGGAGLGVDYSTLDSKNFASPSAIGSNGPVVTQPANVTSKAPQAASWEPNNSVYQGGKAAGGAMAQGIGKLIGGGGANATADAGLGGAGPSGVGGMAGGMDAVDSLAAAAPVLVAAQGGQIGGQASVAGNSPDNDDVPALLSPKEIVLPRSVTMSKDPAGAAASFVDAIKKTHKPNEKVEFKHVLDAHKNLHDRISQLEKMYGGGMA